MCTDCDEITQGIPGYNGWSPTFETVVDAVNLDGDGNSRVVLRLTSWIGGEGPVPTIHVGEYLTTGGYTATLASATNIRGEKGVDGAQGDPGTAGKGITSIIRTSGTGLAGSLDTYTITYTDATTSTFDVQNGSNGSNGSNGTNGTNGSNGEGYELSSNTSVTLPAGAVTILTVDKSDTNSAYTSGARVRVSDTASPATNYFEGVLVSFTGTTFSISVDFSTGAGTITSWNINTVGDRGTTGGGAITPADVLTLDISADIDKECLSGLITGNTLEDYLNGIIASICAGGSTPTYDTQVTFFGEDLNVINNETIIAGPPATVAAALVALPGVGDKTFTIPVGVTQIQVELWGAGGAETAGTITNNSAAALFTKDDGDNYFYVLQSDPGSSAAVFLNAGGVSNCPTVIMGSAGDISLTTDPALGGAAASSGYNYGNTETPAASLATGGAGGSYGKVTLTVVPGDDYYIYTNCADSATPTNNLSSKVVISYNA